MLVQISSEEFRNYNLMLSEREAVHYPNYSRTIRGILLFDRVQDFVFNLCIVKIELLIPADLDSYLSPGFFNIEALHYLPESPFIHDITHNISVTNLFTDSCSVVALSICDFGEGLPPVAADSVNLLEL